jgi:hypothetical protein
MKVKLPKMEHSFSINVNGRETGVVYVGDFLFVRPTLGDRSKIDVMHKRLNGDLTTLNNDTFKFNEAISYLRFSLKEFPTWWEDSGMGINLYDSNVVVEVYNKCVEYEADFLAKLHGDKLSEENE